MGYSGEGMKIADILEIASRLRKEGEWQCIWEHNKPKYIRDKAGCLVEFYHPNKYSRQEERYQQESKEVVALSEFILASREMGNKLGAIHELSNFDKYVPIVTNGFLDQRSFDSGFKAAMYQIHKILNHG